MDTRYGATLFCLLGLVFSILTLRAVWRGEIREPDHEPLCRSSEPLKFYLLVVSFGLLALLLLGAGVWSFLYPGTIQVWTGGDAD